MAVKTNFGDVDPQVDSDTRLEHFDVSMQDGANDRNQSDESHSRPFGPAIPKSGSINYVKDLSLSRRNLLVGTVAIAVSSVVVPFGGHAEAQGFDASGIKALVFDVIGTTADYWDVITNDGESFNQKKGLSLDWSSVIAAWHPLDLPGFADILNERRPWQSPSLLRLDALQNVLNNLAPGQFSNDEVADINSVWQRMALWPDTLPGLQRLKRRYTLATLSNADMGDMVKLAKLRGLPWDAVMASELAQTVKPSPKVYQLAPQYLGLRPEEIMMVACHKLDLRAAKLQGLRTAFVSRPLERGPKGQVDTKPDPDFDLNATSFLDLADILNA